MRLRMVGDTLRHETANVAVSNYTGTRIKTNTIMHTPCAGMQLASVKLIVWKEEDKLSCIVDHAALKNNDHKISSSRYIHTSDDETYRPIAEIVDELDVIEVEAKETDKALREILKKIGVSS